MTISLAVLLTLFVPGIAALQTPTAQPPSSSTSEPLPSFEVIAIHPNMGGGRAPRQLGFPPGGRFVAINVSVMGLIRAGAEQPAR